MIGKPMLDLNTETAEELDRIELLKGHSFEIVHYREERHGFTALRQLGEVPGLAGKTETVDQFVLIASERAAETNNG